MPPRTDKRLTESSDAATGAKAARVAITALSSDPEVKAWHTAATATTTTETKTAAVPAAAAASSAKQKWKANKNMVTQEYDDDTVAAAAAVAATGNTAIDSDWLRFGTQGATSSTSAFSSSNNNSVNSNASFGSSTASFSDNVGSWIASAGGASQPTATRPPPAIVNTGWIMGAAAIGGNSGWGTTAAFASGNNNWPAATPAPTALVTTFSIPSKKGSKKGSSKKVTSSSKKGSSKKKKSRGSDDDDDDGGDGSDDAGDDNDDNDNDGDGDDDSEDGDGNNSKKQKKGAPTPAAVKTATQLPSMVTSSVQRMDAREFDALLLASSLTFSSSSSSSSSSEQKRVGVRSHLPSRFSWQHPPSFFFERVALFVRPNVILGIQQVNSSWRTSIDQASQGLWKTLVRHIWQRSEKALVAHVVALNQLAPFDWKEFCLARCSSTRTSGNAAFSSPFPSSTSATATTETNTPTTELAINAPVSITQSATLTFSTSCTSPPIVGRERASWKRAGHSNGSKDDSVPRRAPYFNGGDAVLARVTGDTGAVHDVQYMFHKEDDESISIWAHDLTTGRQMWDAVASPAAHTADDEKKMKKKVMTTEEEEEAQAKSRKVSYQIGHFYQHGSFSPSVRAGEPSVLCYWNSDAALIGVNAITGRFLWQYDAQTATSQDKAGWKVAGDSWNDMPHFPRPFAIPGAFIIIGYNCSLIAISATTGLPIWSIAPSTPCRKQGDNGHMMNGGGNILGVEGHLVVWTTKGTNNGTSDQSKSKQNGRCSWLHVSDMRTKRGVSSKVLKVLNGDNVFTVSDGVLYANSLGSDSQDAMSVWTIDLLSSTDTLKWRTDIDDEMGQQEGDGSIPPVVYGGRCFVWCVLSEEGPGWIVALDCEKGSMKKKKKYRPGQCEDPERHFPIAFTISRDTGILHACMTNIAQGKLQLLSLSTVDLTLLREVVLQDPKSAYYDDDQQYDEKRGVVPPPTVKGANKDEDGYNHAPPFKPQAGVIGTIFDNGWCELSPWCTSRIHDTVLQVSPLKLAVGWNGPLPDEATVKRRQAGKRDKPSDAQIVVGFIHE